MFDAAMFDIAIIGAGPVGCVIAHLLAQNLPSSVKIAVFNNQPAPLNHQQDTRTLALNYGSIAFLKQQQCWVENFSPIKHIHVSQQHRMGRTQIDCADFNIPMLGAVVALSKLQQALSLKLNHATISLFENGCATATNQLNGNGVTITQGAQQYQAKIAIICDGKNNADIQKTYDQLAIVTAVQAQLPQAGWAWERFTNQGPLAILPHPCYANAQSVVWCIDHKLKDEVLGMSSTQFNKTLTQNFSSRLGKLNAIEPLQAFPLKLNALRNPHDENIVYIGNAAQTLHPVAGQGLNLGLRDAAVLSKVLHKWFHTNFNNIAHADPRIALAQYARERKIDRWLTRQITDTLPRIFSTKFAPLEHLCGLGLMAMDFNGMIRAPLANHLLQGWR